MRPCGADRATRGGLPPEASVGDATKSRLNEGNGHSVRKTSAARICRNL